MKFIYPFSEILGEIAAFCGGKALSLAKLTEMKRSEMNLRDTEQLHKFIDMRIDLLLGD